MVVGGQVMESLFKSLEIEQKWSDFWMEHKLFSPEVSPEKEAYTIMIPPPNVTGSLHMGHAFQHTVMDTLIRYNKMQGKNVLWQMGTDHAGIATQMIVERGLQEKEGKSKEELGRQAFLEKAQEWKEFSAENIRRQIQRLGSSVDWESERFTLDVAYVESVIQAFVELYDKGLIYKDTKLVNWDPVLQTALADLEVLKEEVEAFIYHLAYKLEGSHEQLVVATTRPETLFGDVAVAVHPEDSRYAQFIGKKVQLPLCDRLVEVIADASVEQDFGTGCLKITPAHDFNDFTIGKRHQLPLINILTPEAKLNDKVPEMFQGLSTPEARKKVLEELQSQGLLIKTQAHTIQRPVGDRSNATIEPYLTEQWFVRTQPLAEKAKQMVNSKELEIVPEQWKNVFFSWMNAVEDWCISRQIWWGHRIPAWYDGAGNVFVGLSESEVRKKYQLAEDAVLRQDEDVLDTWFSSALWTFATLGWPEDTQRLRMFHPTSLLVTGFDIIFFWVARMMMFSGELLGQIPFRQVYVHGLIRDTDGQKMSKSKGNVIDPLDIVEGIDKDKLLEKRTSHLMQTHLKEQITQKTLKEFPDGIQTYGADALRFNFLALATHGRDIRFNLKRIEGYRNFINKLWNASRFVLQVCQGFEVKEEKDRQENFVDSWLACHLQTTTKAMHKHFADYRFDLAAQEVYSFVWDSYCDWYLEMQKLPIYRGSDLEKQAAQYSLLTSLEQILCLLHPMIPFVTEEIWQHLKPLLARGEISLVQRQYPQADEEPADSGEMQFLQDVVRGARAIFARYDLRPSEKNQQLRLCIIPQESTAFQENTELSRLIAFLLKVPRLDWLSQVPEKTAQEVVPQATLAIPLEGLIDFDKEKLKQTATIQKLKQEAENIQTLLSNQKFLEKASREIQESKKTRLEELQQQIKAAEQALENLG